MNQPLDTSPSIEEDTSPPMRGLDDQEESVRIAVKALGDMRNMNSSGRSRAPSQSVVILPPLTMPPSSSTLNTNNNNISVASGSSSTSNSEPTASSPAFVSRMSHFPLVGSALRVYEQGKASSRVVKYGAEMVESSVKSISRPVIDRLPVNVNQLDEFACRQLDRLDKYRRPSTSGENPNANANPSPSSPTPTPTSASGSNLNLPSLSERDRGRPKLKTKTLDGSALDDREEESDFGRGEGGGDSENAGYRMQMQGPILTSDDGSSRRGLRERRGGGGGGKSVPKWLEATSPFVAPPPPPPDSRGSTPTRNGDRSERSYSFSYSNSNSRSDSKTTSASGTANNTNATGGSERQVAQRSRWQAVLLEAGGLSAALSEESMRRLKYCLQWLQYATAHIDAQILILRDFTASLQIPPTSPTSSSSSAHRPPHPPISEEHMRKLTDVRRDIVHTIRQVVDVVSKYAGGALPEPARGRVRGFILKLPQRWASRAGAGPSGANENGGDGERERDRDRETVTAAAGSGTGVVRRAGGQRRAAQRERGVDAGNGIGSGLRSGASSVAVSPSSSPRVGRAVLGGGYETSGHHSHGSGGGGQVSANSALVASQRILTLATESLDMMRNVTGVVKDSLDRADAWVGRLRTVGIQRGVNDGDALASEDGSSANGAPRSPSTSTSAYATARDRQEGFEFEFSDRMRYRHSRTGSTQSMQSQLDDDRDMELDRENHHVRVKRERGQAVEMDGDQDQDHDGVRSPFFSAASSTAWGSSIPSTPGGTNSSANMMLSSTVFSSGSSSGPSGSPHAHTPSHNTNTVTIPIGAMTLQSRYGTPKNGIVGLPKEEEEEDAKKINLKLSKIVGARDESDIVEDVLARREEEEEEEGIDMDVDHAVVV